MSAQTVASTAYRQVPGTPLRTYVFDSHTEMAVYVARLIANVIRERNEAGQYAVLGLATGSSPVSVYRELIRMHKEEGLDFSRTFAFALDEYYGLSDKDEQSFRDWLYKHFFSQVNIPESQWAVPGSLVPDSEIEEHCRWYEECIQAAGGIDVQLLGIGRNGHIGFNEPYSPRFSRTRRVTLDEVTRKDAASDFYGEDHVPMQAITMGIGTIMQARKIILMALGEHKAAIIREALEGEVTERVPASFLREHLDATVLLDEAAASELKGVATPWLLGEVEWTGEMAKRAVLWLSREEQQPLLKLDASHFLKHNLYQLLRARAAEGGASQFRQAVEVLTREVFEEMMRSINHHPAGVCQQGVGRKRILCFSPHPDDDVISMGGTLIRLNEDGHEVHVAYMTSGNIAVFDHDAENVARMVAEYNRHFGIDPQASEAKERWVAEELRRKRPRQQDHPDIRAIKALIRRCEAKSAATVCGCKLEHLHFLNLPFYETGTIEKRPVGDEDRAIIRRLIEEVQPDQIYMAGDFSDPHGTHRVCAQGILQVLQQLQAETGRCYEVLLYRGAWQEWAPHEVEIAVPLSPADMERKKHAIFRHESQKDTALFPGADGREFWQRAQDRNINTAKVYNELGLPEYYAMEGFVRYRGQRL
jgi:glucosamine-6-phosphate deaminase